MTVETETELMPLDEALAIVFSHNEQGSPWIIGQSRAIDLANRTVQHYAKRALELYARGEREDQE